MQLAPTRSAGGVIFGMPAPEYLVEEERTRGEPPPVISWMERSMGGIPLNIRPPAYNRHPGRSERDMRSLSARTASGVGRGPVIPGVRVDERSAPAFRGEHHV